MKCPYCAETLQDEAIVCRFCGAEKRGDQWSRDRSRQEPPPAPRKGLVTIRIAAVFFVLSALFELAAHAMPVPLAGELRSGPVALAYHGLYVALFLAMGAGLWMAAPWGYRAMWIGTVVYTADKLRAVLDTEARQAEIASLLAGYEGLFGAEEIALVPLAMNITALVSVLCWWGFLAWLWFRRSTFGLA